MLLIFRALSRCKSRVSFGGHNEVVFVQPLDGMCPPCDCHLTPFGQQTRRVTFLFSQRANAIGEDQTMPEIVEHKCLGAMFNPIPFHTFPPPSLPTIPRT